MLDDQENKMNYPKAKEKMATSNLEKSIFRTNIKENPQFRQAFLVRQDFTGI